MYGKLTLVGLLMVTVLLFAGPSRAQDPGVLDTVLLQPVAVPDFTTGKTDLIVELWVYSDEPLIGATTGFRWDNPKVQMDSAVAEPLIDDGFEIGPFFYENTDINVTNANLRFLVGGAVLFGTWIPPDPSLRHWATYYFTATDWGECEEVSFDTLIWNEGSDFLFVTTNNVNLVPQWAGGFTIADTACAPSNEPPVLDVIGDKETTEGLNLNFGVSAADPDLTFPSLSVSALPAGATFVSAPDGNGTFDWSPGFTDAGSYPVTFYATDAVDPLLVDSELVVILVNDSNRVPVLTLTPGQDTEVFEGGVLMFTVSASDPDLTVPALTAYINGSSSLAPNMVFVDDGAGGGVLTFTPDFTQGNDDPTPYVLRFRATDADDVDLYDESLPLTLYCFNVNQPPEIAPVNDQSVCADGSSTIDAAASDPDGNMPTLWAEPIVANMVFADAGDGTGQLTFSPTMAQIGEYPTTFYASDGEDTVETSFLITVVDCAAQDTGKVIFTPDPVYALMKFGIEPVMATMYVGDFIGGHDVSDVDVSSLMIDGFIPAAVTDVIPNYYGLFDGDVLRIVFPINPFIEQYGLLWDTSIVAYTLTGVFNDESPILLGGTVPLIGHRKGDVNADGSINVGDISALVGYLFLGDDTPIVVEAADVDGICDLSLSDVRYLVRFLFQGGEAPKADCTPR